MPCHSAVLDDKLTVIAEEKVSKAIDLLKKKKVSFLPIVDEEGILLGYFSAQTLLSNIVPVALDRHSGVQLDSIVGTAPGVAKRLKNAMNMPVYQYCERRFHAVRGDTPIWEGLKSLLEYGAPLFVVEGDNNKYTGMITELSALEEMQTMKE